MKRRYWLWLLPVLAGACARMGQPSGGDKDVTPPKVVSETPPSGTVNFKGNKIVIKFDELAQLDNPQQKIVFSPPLAAKPEISPLGYPAREVTIRFKKPLQPGVTYAIRFGDAIKDYHEGNVLRDYTYVFSTGPVLDSLQFSGKAVAVPDYDLPENTFAGLYPAKDFSDSIVFRQPPFYLARVNKSTGQFTLNHLKQGEYVLIVFSDENGNMTYQPYRERIGFAKRNIHISGDTSALVPVFTEPKPFALQNLTEKSAGHWTAKLDGTPRNVQVAVDGHRVLDYVREDIWHIWIKNTRKGDTLRFVFHKGNDTLARRTLPVTMERIDTLIFRWEKNKIFPVDSLRLLTNVPVEQLNSAKLRINPRYPGDTLFLNAMGLPVFRFAYTEDRTKAGILILPGALKGINGITNSDTLKTTLNFAPARETGTYTLIWPGAQDKKLIVELTDQKGEKVFRRFVTHGTKRFVFPYLLPGKYRLRFLVDANGNGRWDAGHWIGRVSPEPVIVYPKTIEIRANWDVEEKFVNDNKAGGKMPAHGGFGK